MPPRAPTPSPLQGRLAPAASHAPARHSLWSALSVVGRTIGRVPSGPRGAGEAPGAQRHTTVRVAADHEPRALSHLVAGDPAGPRLLLVHGTPGSAQGWADYLRDAPAGFEVVAIDRPGFGHSGPARAEVRLAAQADAVAALLPDDGRDAVLLGHSLGGAVAAQAAAAQPRRVRALILVAAALDPSLERIHPLQRIGQWPLVRAGLPRAIRNANEELLALRAELVALERVLERIRCPVFLVHGSDDDLVPVANVAYAQQRLRGAAHVVTELLPGRNHFLPWNAQAELRRVIAAAGRLAC